MPEISEVLITSDFLNIYCKNYEINDIKILKGRYKNHPNSMKEYEMIKKNLPVKIKNINTKGKFLWFKLENKNKEKIYLLNTFGMSGSWDFIKENNSNVEFTIKKNKEVKKLYFTDPRNFGTITFSNKETLDNKLLCLGEDLLKNKLDSNILKKRLEDYIKVSKKRCNNKIVKVLMGQSKKDGIGSGIGNYLSAEILYDAKISPHRTVQEIYNDNKLIKKLTKSIKLIIKLSYYCNYIGYMERFEDFKKIHDKLVKNKKINNYHMDVNIKNKKFLFNVYRQKLDKNKNKVKGEKIINGRTTYWVPKVQL